MSQSIYVLDSIVVSIPACHAGGRGSIPRRGEFFFQLLTFRFEILFLKNCFIFI